MGYLFLTLALLGGLIKGFASKHISRDVGSLCDGFAVNVTRSLFCSLLGLAVAAITLTVSGEGISSLLLSPASLLICLLSSIGMALFSISWLYAYQTEAYVFLSVFTMLGATVTGLLGRLVYGDPLSPPRILGILLLFASVYVLSLYSRRLGCRITLRGALVLLLGTVGVACADFMQRVFVKQGGGNASVFTLYTYLLMLLPQLLVLMLFRVHGKCPQKMLRDKRHTLTLLLISAALYLNTLSKTFAAGFLPATLLYPTLQGANLIFSALLAALLLRERITGRSLLGILLALTAVLLMNL